MPVVNWYASSFTILLQRLPVPLPGNLRNPTDQIHPHLKGFTDLLFENPDIDALMRMLPSLRFSHCCHDVCRKTLSRGIKVVDLSADYRLPKGYMKKCTVLCIPIISRHLTESRAAPYRMCQCEICCESGVFPTGATLAAAPLAKYAHTIIFDSKTGVSGAGDILLQLPTIQM